VQTGGGLVENVKCTAGLALGKFACELDALGFAAGKSCGGLAELDIAEADFNERGKLLLNLRMFSRSFSASEVGRLRMSLTE